MGQSIQYVVNDNGQKTSVIVPFHEWEQLNSRYEKLLNKLDVLTGIKESIKEIKQSKKTGVKLQSLSDYLNENGY